MQGVTYRDVFSVALSAPGVSALGSGQAQFAAGTNFSANGMRVRSNNFTIDGQDSNSTQITGRQQPINNTDIIQEVRLITNQFAAEFGRAAGAVVSAVTKSGTNSFRGSAFWFHNDESLNSRTNLDKAAKRASAPFQEENQYGGTLGGPLVRNRTFFFGSYQRWTDRQLGSGFTLSGAPTDVGARSAAVGRRRPSSDRGAAPVRAGRNAERQERKVRPRRPDLYRAARGPHRLLVDRLQQRSGDGPSGSHAFQPHDHIAVPARTHTGEFRLGTGDAAGADDRQHVE